jgi:hypothetical protein
MKILQLFNKMKNSTLPFQKKKLASGLLKGKKMKRMPKEKKSLLN